MATRTAGKNDAEEEMNIQTQGYRISKRSSPRDEATKIIRY
jgi:hypothetical protein